MADKKDSFLTVSSQAILLMNIQELLSNSPIGSTVKRDKNFGYTNFCLFRSDDPNNLQLTKYSKNSNITNFLNKIPDNIISAIMPNIKLYKVFYENDKKYSWRVPFDDISLQYTNKTSQFQDSSIIELMEGKGRLHGIGIKSFKYKYTGTDSVSTNTNLEGEMELYFQDIRDLAKKINIFQDDVNYVGSKPKVNRTFSYSDLLTYNEPDSVSMDRNPLRDEIRAVISYSDISVKDIEDLLHPATKDRSKFAKEIKNTLLSSKLLLTICPIRHNLSFEEYGNTTLKIEFIGRLQSSINNEGANILQISEYYNDYITARKHLSNVEEEKKSKELEITENPENKLLDKEQVEKNVESGKETLDRNYKTALELSKKDVEFNLNKVYQSLFSKLLFPKDDNIGIYSVKINPEVYGAKFETSFVNGFVIGPQQTLEDTDITYKIQNLQKAGFISNSYKKISLAQQTLSETDPQYSELALKYNKNSGEPEAGSNFISQIIGKIKGTPDEVAKSLAVAVEGNQKKQLSDDETLQEIKFVFLGDILEIFYKGLKFNTIDNPRIILSSFNLKIPDINGTDIKEIPVNLADLPITLDYLQYFFLEKIIKPRVSVYTLWNFLIDIMSDLVSSCTNPTLYANSLEFNNSVKISNTFFSLPFKDSRDQFTDLPKQLKFGKYSFFNGNIDENKLQILNESSNFSLIDPDFDQDLANYIIFYCSNQVTNKTKFNNGNIEKDQKDGIPHFFVGKDKGFIKKINFSRLDAPYTKESAAARTSGGLVSGVSRLKEVYDCTINMFGNNAFRNGDIIYVEPLIYVGNVAADLTNTFGIGGYYQVISVETTINENIFETVLKSTAVTSLGKDANNQDVTVQAAGIEGKK